MSELLRAVAFVFRFKGTGAMPASDLRLALAFDLRWYAPQDASRLVERALAMGLLVQDGAGLRPTFDPLAVDVPLGFRPGPRALEEDEPIDLPARREGGSPASLEMAAEAERARRGGLVSPEVARLVVARRAGEDVRARAAAEEKRLLGP